MKVPFSQPIAFASGDLLAPGDLNDVFRFAGETLLEASSRRWQHSVLVLQFVTSIGSPYTNATAAAVRTFRVTCPNTCIVERAILSANMTSSAEVQVNIVSTSGGTAPAGATTPWLTSGGAVTSATDETSDVNPDRVLLVAGAEYIIAVTGSGVFTLGRFDLQLHLLVDRFTPSGTLLAPSYSPTLFTDASAPDATVVAANQSSLTTEVAKLANVVAPVPILFGAYGIVSGTDPDIRTFTLPRFSSTRAQARIIRMYLRVEAAAVVAANYTVSATLKSAAGATLASVSQNMNGLAGASVDSGLLNVPLAGAVSAETTTDDYSIVIANTDAANTASKVTCLLWVSR